MQIGSMLSNIVSHNPKMTTLTSDQRQTLSSILEKYDGVNFSKSDFENLSNELRAAGIRPSAEVKSALESKGINVDSYVSSAQGAEASPPVGGPPPGGGPGGPPPPKKEESSDDDSDSTSISAYYSSDESLTESIAAFLEKLKSGSVTKEDSENLLSLFSSANVPPNGLLVDKKV